mgnify:FL=1
MKTRIKGICTQIIREQLKVKKVEEKGIIMYWKYVENEQMISMELECVHYSGSSDAFEEILVKWSNIRLVVIIFNIPSGYQGNGMKQIG